MVSRFRIYSICEFIWILRSSFICSARNCLSYCSPCKALFALRFAYPSLATWLYFCSDAYFLSLHHRKLFWHHSLDFYCKSYRAPFSVHSTVSPSVSAATLDNLSHSLFVLSLLISPSILRRTTGVQCPRNSVKFFSDTFRTLNGSATRDHNIPMIKTTSSQAVANRV